MHYCSLYDVRRQPDGTKALRFAETKGKHGGAGAGAATHDPGRAFWEEQEWGSVEPWARVQEALLDYSPTLSADSPVVEEVKLATANSRNQCSRALFADAFHGAPSLDH